MGHAGESEARLWTHPSSVLGCLSATKIYLNSARSALLVNRLLHDKYHFVLVPELISIKYRNIIKERRI